MGMSMQTLLIRTFCNHGDRWANCVRRYQIGGDFDFTLTSVNAMTTALSGHWSQIHAFTLPSAARYVGLEWEFHDHDDAILGSGHSKQNATPGINEGAILPTQICGLVYLPTVQGSPARTRALQYLPFPTVNFSDANGKLSGLGTSRYTTAGSLIGSNVTDSLARVYIPISWRRKDLSGYRLLAGRALPGLAQQRRRGGQWPLPGPPVWI